MEKFKIRNSKFSISILIILFAFAISSCSNSTNKTIENRPIVSDIESEKAKIKTVLTEMWDAIENEDVEKYASYIHKDFTQFGETDPVLKIGKKVEINGIHEWVASSSNIHTDMLKPRVTIKDDVAWITYYWSDSGITNEKKFASRGKSTRIFVKENGKWLCIHGHYTLLPNTK